jgi:hypothetical protein
LFLSLFIENSPGVFLFLTVILGGGAAFQAGRAMAGKWRAVWLTAFYMVLLGCAVRFLHFALFEGELLSLHYFITDTLVLILAAMLGYRLTRVRQMTSQYPWLYERSGPLSWREKKLP